MLEYDQITALQKARANFSDNLQHYVTAEQHPNDYNINYGLLHLAIALESIVLQNEQLKAELAAIRQELRSK